MTWKSLGLLLSVLVLAFGVAACGGDDEEEPAGGGTPTTENVDVPVDNEQIEAAVEQCKTSIQAQTQLSEELRAELEGICDKAGSGDIEDAQQASVEVCVKIAEEMVPEGAARDQVIASCEQAAP